MGTYKPIEQRLAAKTRRSGDCLLWTGATRSNGYGVIGLERNAGVGSPHRVAYEIHKGPIPEGLHIDHLCRNRICVNPDHLEAKRGMCRTCHVLAGRARRRGMTVAQFLGEEVLA